MEKKEGGAGLSRLAQEVRNDRPSRSDEEEEEVWGGGRDITNPKFAFVFPLSKFLITAASGLHPSFLPACSLARSLAAAVAAAAPVAARRPNQCGVFVRLSCSTTTSALYFLVVQPHRVELSS
jgi:hypothetical protein